MIKQIDNSLKVLTRKKSIKSFKDSTQAHNRRHSQSLKGSLTKKLPSLHTLINKFWSLCAKLILSIRIILQSVEENIRRIFASKLTLEFFFLWDWKLCNSRVVEDGPPFFSKSTIKEIVSCWNVRASMADKTCKVVFAQFTFYRFVA